MSINRFMDEVISRGAEAVLPHNLNEEWLEHLFIASKSFLSMAIEDEASAEEEEPFKDENSMMLLTAVTELFQSQKNYMPDEADEKVDEGIFFKNLSCYALSILFETIQKESEFTFEQPTIETIFSRERLYEIEQETPVITEILNEIVIGKEPEVSKDA